MTNKGPSPIPPPTLEMTVSVSSLIEALPDALVVLNAQGVIFLVNAQAEYLFGRSRAEMIGSRVETLMPERFRSEHVKLRSGYVSDPRLRNTGAKIKVLSLQRDGTEIEVDVALAPMMTQSGMFVLATLRRRVPP